VANETAKRLRGRVREIRETLGLTQEAFAERAGLKYKHYQSFEAGRKTDIRFSTLEKLARACGIELRDLVDFDAPLAVAEDPAEAGYRAVRGTTARRTIKARSGGKKA